MAGWMCDSSREFGGLAVCTKATTIYKIID